MPKAKCLDVTCSRKFQLKKPLFLYFFAKFWAFLAYSRALIVISSVLSCSSFSFSPRSNANYFRQNNIFRIKFKITFFFSSNMWQITFCSSVNSFLTLCTSPSTFLTMGIWGLPLFSPTKTNKVRLQTKEKWSHLKKRF